MPRRLVLLLPALLLAACSGGASSTAAPAFTLNLGTARPSAAASAVGATPVASRALPSASPPVPPTPSATATPSATPVPTAVPTPRPTPTPAPTPAPTPLVATARPTTAPGTTAEPSPTESEDLTASTSRGLLVETLLTAEELPADLTAGQLEESASVNDQAFAANNGLRVVRIVWEGTGENGILGVFDYRYQFPNEDDAATFLEEAKEFLSESGSGMAEATDPEVGELSYLYTGEVDAFDSFNFETFSYNVLFRVGNVVAKVWVNVPATQDPDVPIALAKTAAVKLTKALGLGPFPNEDEAAILALVPVDIRPSCHRADPIYRDEVDTITCDGSADHPPIDYTLFRSAAAVNGAFERDLARADPAPTADGQCDAGNYVATYAIDGAVAGRIMCFTSIDDTGRTFKVIEWTNTQRRILAFMSSTARSWDSMIDFWRDKAGPII